MDIWIYASIDALAAAQGTISYFTPWFELVSKGSTGADHCVVYVAVYVQYCFDGGVSKYPRSSISIVLY
jgi:hypothetical protein